MLNAAVEMYWTSEFKRIRFLRDEVERKASIRSCFKAACENAGLVFQLRDDHPHFSEIKEVFGNRHLDVEAVPVIRWDAPRAKVA